MLVTDRLLDCWYLTGPTAAGKTEVGLALAQELNAEIISLDSMALYRYMDIGTAKPDRAARQQVPHHLLDVVDPSDEFSLHSYVAAATEVAAEIRQRGHQVLFVGGTPLYLKALLRGICVGPPPDWEFRQAVTAEAAQRGNQALHDRLRQVDPLSAAKLHPNDLRRIVRALEVYKATRQPLGHLQLQFEQANPATACRVFVLDWARPELHARIDARVVAMFEHGLRQEVESICQQFPQLSRTAQQAVGYCETMQWLAGAATFDETLHRIQVRTHQFAKRQVTWFRSLSEAQTVPCQAGSSPQQLVSHMLLGRGRSD